MRTCKLCGANLGASWRRSYRICSHCEKKALEIAQNISLVRPIIYNDFGELFRLGVGEVWALFDIKSVLIDNGYKCHEARKRGEWDCDLGETECLSPVYRGHTHFHRLA